MAAFEKPQQFTNRLLLRTKTTLTCHDVLDQSSNSRKQRGDEMSPPKVPTHSPPNILPSFLSSSPSSNFPPLTTPSTTTPLLCQTSKLLAYKATGSSNITLRNMQSGKDTLTMESTSPVQLMSFSPRGNFLVTWERYSASASNNLKVFSIADGSLAYSFVSKNAPTNRENLDVCWTWNESFLLKASGGNSISVYDVKAKANVPPTRIKLTGLNIKGALTISLSNLDFGHEGPDKILDETKFYLSAFTPGDKNSPGRVGIYSFTGGESGENENEREIAPIASKSTFAADSALTLWSPHATSVCIITLSTSVDRTGSR